MTLLGLEEFKEINLWDFEFSAPRGEVPVPICFVVHELKSRITRRGFVEDFKEPPFDIGPNSLNVAYYSSAEISCHLALGWRIPINILDLFCEFRCHTNHATIRESASLLNALSVFKLDSIQASEKEEMRALALRGGPFTEGEKKALLDYCETDVHALSKLLPVMMPHIDLERALLRGRYMAVIAIIEQNGIPMDVERYELFNKHWKTIQKKLVEKVNSEFGVYEGTSFRQKKFLEYLRRENIRWPRLPSGKLNLSDETFRSMSLAHDKIGKLRDIRFTLSKMKLSDLAVGSDGRSRCMLSPFSSKTSRNQPSTSKFPFGLASWQRNLIKPERGFALAYVDWEQQEFGTAAALSGDFVMMEAYSSGDPYLTFAKQAGAIPKSATKQSHSKEREQFKLAALGVQYGMGAQSLALQLDQPIGFARELLALHRRTYPRFWEWQEGVVCAARYKKSIQTTFGWKMRVSPSAGARTIANFPVQANGAEMLRIAIIYAIEKGIKICAPVHDALLIEASEDSIAHAVIETQECMRRASKIVLGNFELRSDVKIIRYPDCYTDPRGQYIWKEVNEIVAELEG